MPVDPAERMPADVRRMFDGIADRYDLANRILSLGRHRAWRRAAASMLAPREGSRLLDLCAGTGDLALAFARFRPGRIVCADFSGPMLLRGRAKIERARLGCPVSWVRADALSLPFRDASFDGAGVAFGVRNFADRANGLSELARVLKPGASLVVLEFARPPDTLLGRLAGWFASRVVPGVGQAVSRSPDRAYHYLARTIEDFPDPAGFAVLLESAGFADVRRKTRAFGVVAMYAARRR
ncbi:MAG: ubiquinone/menaquinone biosynthesis methyltransferase [Planctomycetota bacterium]